ADHVRKDVNLGLFPANKTSVVPDFFGGRQHPNIISALRDISPFVRGNFELEPASTGGASTLDLAGRCEISLTAPSPVRSRNRCVHRDRRSIDLSDDFPTRQSRAGSCPLERPQPPRPSRTV